MTVLPLCSFNIKHHIISDFTIKEKLIDYFKKSIIKFIKTTTKQNNTILKLSGFALFKFI